MKSYRKLVRPAALLLAAAVAVLACSVVANAQEEVAFVPRGQGYAYNLAPGAVLNIPVPMSNLPVSVTGTCTTPGFRGVAGDTLLRTAVAPLFLEWVGLESAWPGVQAITKGFSATPGVHIVYLDWQHLVDIVVANAASIRVHNSAAGPRQGFVTLMY
jgi:hypothetical protein